MLQQTQVDRVLPSLRRVARELYPTLQALAAAPEREVTETWHPLGYNTRPTTSPHDSPRIRCSSTAATLPADEETLRSFKGIGVHGRGHSQLRVSQRACHPRHERGPRPLLEYSWEAGIQRATR